MKLEDHDVKEINLERNSYNVGEDGKLSDDLFM